MKVGILAGGLGTRLQEKTQDMPKPMVEIGGKPMLWHIMSLYRRYGLSDFVLGLGYKKECINRYFMEHKVHSPLVQVDMKSGSIKSHGIEEDWKVDLLDTGLHSLTGGRVKRISEHIGNETFMLTYGDGVSDVDIDKLLAFHKSHGKIATLTAVRPPSRFGHVNFENGQVKSFGEKQEFAEGWINGGFFILEPEIRDYIQDDMTTFEKVPLEKLVSENQLMAYEHEGFWQCMDTIRDVQSLEEIWNAGSPPWLRKI